MSRSSVTDEGNLTSSVRLPLRFAAMPQLWRALLKAVQIRSQSWLWLYLRCNETLWHSSQRQPTRYRWDAGTIHGGRRRMRLLFMMYCHWTIICASQPTWSWISIQTSLSPLWAAHWLIPKWIDLQVMDKHLNGRILLFAMTKWGTWTNRFCLRTKSCSPLPVLSLWVAWCPLIGAVILSFSHLWK